MIVKSSRTFVWSSTAQATYSHAGQRRIISKPASFNEVARVSESRLCRRGHTSRAQHHTAPQFYLRMGARGNISNTCRVFWRYFAYVQYKFLVACQWWKYARWRLVTGPLKITCAVLRPGDSVASVDSVDTATVVPLSKKAWAASAEWCRGSPVARLLGHNPRHHHRHNTQQRGEKGAAKSKKWFEFSMKRSPLCWRLFTPDIATPPPPPPHRRAAGVWTFLRGWRRETRFE